MMYLLSAGNRSRSLFLTHLLNQVTKGGFDQAIRELVNVAGSLVAIEANQFALWNSSESDKLAVYFLFQPSEVSWFSSNPNPRSVITRKHESNSTFRKSPSQSVLNGFACPPSDVTSSSICRERRLTKSLRSSANIFRTTLPAWKFESQLRLRRNAAVVAEAAALVKDSAVCRSNTKPKIVTSESSCSSPISNLSRNCQSRH